VRILIVDDHEVVRKGLVTLLGGEDGLEVVGEAGTVESAIRRVGYDRRASRRAERFVRAGRMCAC